MTHKEQESCWSATLEINLVAQTLVCLGDCRNLVSLRGAWVPNAPNSFMFFYSSKLDPGNKRQSKHLKLKTRWYLTILLVLLLSILVGSSILPWLVCCVFNYWLVVSSYLVHPLLNTVCSISSTFGSLFSKVFLLYSIAFYFSLSQSWLVKGPIDFDTVLLT